MKHECDIEEFTYRWRGRAVEYCYEDDDGRLFVQNSEYSSQVRYCPECGFKAKNQLAAPEKKEPIETCDKKTHSLLNGCWHSTMITTDKK